MSVPQEQIDLLHTHLQTDLSSRAAQFPEFIQTLKKMRKTESDAEASAWARRAVSPLLDYSSLMALRKLLPLETKNRGTENVLRLAILGGATTVQLRQLIEVFLAGEGISAEIYECEYGLYRHEILAAGSQLDLFRPTVVFLAIGARDIARLPAVNDDEATVVMLADDEIASWIQLWETINSKWNAIVIQNNFEISPGSILGHFTLRHPGSREHYLERS